MDDSTERDKLEAARALTGATPALLGLLFGASPAMAENQIKQGRGFYEESTPKKLTTVVGEGGKPILEDVRMAAGKEAYQKPSAESMKGYASKLLKDPSSGHVVQGFQKGLGFVDASGDPIPSTYVEYKAEKTSTARTPYGGQTLSGIDPYTGKPRTIIATPGIGNVMGEEGKPILKAEAETRVSSTKKGKDLIAKHEQDISSIDDVIRELSTTKDPMVFATALGKTQRTAVGENRLSDVEGARYMGNDYKDMLTKGREWFTSKGLGEIPDSIRANAVALANYAKKKASSNKEATRRIYGGTEGLSQRGTEAVTRSLGGKEAQQQTSDWKKKYGF